MPVELTIDDHGVDVRFEGWDALWSVSKGLHVGWSDLVGVRVASVDELEGDLGWRVGGGYWPGRMATGHYTVKDRPGARQLWCVYTDPEVLVLDLAGERPSRVVLQVADRVELADAIGRALAEHRP